MSVAPQLLGRDGMQVTSNGVLMVDADLRQAVRVEQIKLVLRGLRRITEKLFVVQSHLRHMVAQAYALGATGVVRSSREIVFKLAEIEVAAEGGKSRFCHCLTRRRRCRGGLRSRCSRRYETANL